MGIPACFGCAHKVVQQKRAESSVVGHDMGASNCWDPTDSCQSPRVGLPCQASTPHGNFLRICKVLTPNTTSYNNKPASYVLCHTVTSTAAALANCSDELISKQVDMFQLTDSRRSKSSASRRAEPWQYSIQTTNHLLVTCSGSSDAYLVPTYVGSLDSRETRGHRQQVPTGSTPRSSEAKCRETLFRLADPSLAFDHETTRQSCSNFMHSVTNMSTSGPGFTFLSPDLHRI